MTVRDIEARGLEMTDAQKRWAFTLINVQLFVGHLGYAAFAPFFPQEGALKGLSPGVVGWIFGVFQAVVIVFTPITAKLVPAFGPTCLLNVSNFIIAATNIGFGFIWYLGGGAPFAISCFVLRMGLGIGVAIAATVGYGLLPFLFGDRLSTGASILETTIGVGFVCAPMLGSAFYKLGGGAEHAGFVLPFVILGGLQLVLGIYCLVYFPRLPTPPSSTSRLTDFSPMVLVPVIVCSLSAAAIEWTGPNLETYLEDPPFDMGVTGVGLVYGVCSGVYIFAGPLVGMLDDRFEGRHAFRFMSLGFAMMGLSYMELGPAGWVTSALGFQKSQINLWVSIVLIGVGNAFALIPTYNIMYRWARQTTEDEKGNATSNLYNIVYAVGGFVGPTAAGWLGDENVMGIVGSYSAFGALCIVTGVLVLFLTCIPCMSLRTAVVTPSNPSSEVMATAPETLQDRLTD